MRATNGLSHRRCHERLGARLAALASVLAIAACGCDSQPTLLVVDLRTDFVAGVEFSRVRTTVDTLDDDAPRAVEQEVERGEDFVDGQRIAELDGLSKGPLRMRVQLLAKNGAVIAERPVSVRLDGRLLVTVVMTRDCRDVSCPKEDGDPTLTACHGGRCVDPGCTPDTPERCPDPECTDASDCPSGASCASATCIGGECGFDPDSSTCDSGAFCEPETGCRPVEEGCTCATGGSCPGSRWPLRIGEAGNTRPTQIAVADDGAGFVVGQYDDTVEIGGRRWTADGIDVFVLGIEPEGKLRWSVVTEAFGFDQLLGVDLDDAGNVYVSGAVDDSVDLGGGTIAADGLDVLLGSFGADGSPRWSVAQGTTSSEASDGLAVGSDGRAYLGASFVNSTDLGDGPRSANGSQDAAVAAFETADGSPTGWVVQIDSDGDGDGVSDVALGPDGNVFAVGTVDGTQADFGDGALSTGGAEDGWIASWRPDGTLRWATVLGGAGTDTVRWIEVDAERAYVAGFFEGEVDFGGGSIASAGANDGFVAAYGPSDGSHLWSMGFGGSQSDEAWALALDDEGALYVSGWIRGTANIGGASIESAGARDGVVFALEPTDGSLRWVRRIGGPMDDVALPLEAAPEGKLWVTGAFTGEVDLGCGPATARSDQDMFVFPIGR